MGSKNIKKLDRSQGEISFSPSIFNFITILAGLILGVLLTVYSCIYFPWSMQTLDLSFIPPFHIPLFGIIPLVLGAKLLHDMKDSKLLLYKDYVLYAKGLMSWQEHTVRIRYNHLREIEIDQTILQKLFGIGDIVLISMSSQSEDEVYMRGIPNPRHIKDLIEKRRNKFDEQDSMRPEE